MTIEFQKDWLIFLFEWIVNVDCNNFETQMNVFQSKCFDFIQIAPNETDLIAIKSDIHKIFKIINDRLWTK